MITSNKCDISSATAKFVLVNNDNSDVESPVDNAEIFDQINSLSAELRSGILGALAGTAPVITVQSFSRVQSITTWDSIYSYPLKLELKKLARYTPINIAAVDAVAKNIYVRRNTIPLNQLMNSGISIYAPVDTTRNEEFTSTEMQIYSVVLDAFYGICRRWNKLDALNVISGVERTEAINEITFALRTNLVAGFTIEDLRNCCYKLLMVSSWLLNNNAYIERDILPQLLINVFNEDILPAATVKTLFDYASTNIDTYPLDIKTMLRLFRDVQWKL